MASSSRPMTAPVEDADEEGNAVEGSAVNASMPNSERRPTINPRGGDSGDNGSHLSTASKRSNSKGNGKSPDSALSSEGKKPNSGERVTRPRAKASKTVPSMSSPRLREVSYYGVEQSDGTPASLRAQPSATDPRPGYLGPPSQYLLQPDVGQRFQHPIVGGIRRRGSAEVLKSRNSGIGTTNSFPIDGYYDPPSRRSSTQARPPPSTPYYNPQAAYPEVTVASGKNRRNRVKSYYNATPQTTIPIQEASRSVVDRRHISPTPTYAGFVADDHRYPPKDGRPFPRARHRSYKWEEEDRARMPPPPRPSSAGPMSIRNTPFAPPPGRRVPALFGDEDDPHWTMPAATMPPASWRNERRPSVTGMPISSPNPDNARFHDTSGLLTAETLRMVTKPSSSNRSTQSSASQGESDWRRSASSRTTMSSDDEKVENIRINVGQSVVKIGDTKIRCEDGAEIHINPGGRVRSDRKDDDSKACGTQPWSLHYGDERRRSRSGDRQPKLKTGLGLAAAALAVAGAAKYYNAPKEGKEETSRGRSHKRNPYGDFAFDDMPKLHRRNSNHWREWPAEVGDFSRESLQTKDVVRKQETSKRDSSRERQAFQEQKKRLEERMRLKDPASEQRPLREQRVRSQHFAADLQSPLDVASLDIDSDSHLDNARASLGHGLGPSSDSKANASTENIAITNRERLKDDVLNLQEAAESSAASKDHTTGQPLRFHTWQPPELPLAQPTLSTMAFRTSHFNTAHYRNPDFQPEEYKPDLDQPKKSVREQSGYSGRYDSINAYRLRLSDLKKYLQGIFPGEGIEVTLLEDEYKMKIPRCLSQAERDYIKDYIRVHRLDETELMSDCMVLPPDSSSLLLEKHHSENQLDDTHKMKSNTPGITRRRSVGSDSVASFVSDLSSIFDKTSTVGTSDTTLEELGKSALEEAIEVFYQHHELQPLYKAGLAKVGARRLQDNLTRLFKRFGRSLKAEASSPPESKSAVFVYSQSVNIAAGVRSLLLDQPEERMERKPHILEDWLDNLTQGTYDHDQEAEEEDQIQTLEGLKAFMTSSKAFDRLVTDFRMWLKVYQTLTPQPKSAGINNDDSYSGNDPDIDQNGTQGHLAPELEPMDLLPRHDVEQESLCPIDMALEDQVTSVQVDGEAKVFDHLPVASCHGAKARSPIAFLSGILNAASATYHLIQALLRHQPEKGFVRVGWKCRCGKHLDIDVPENCQQSAVKFAQQAAGDSSHSRNVSLTRSESNGSSASSSSPTTVNSTATPSSDGDTEITAPSSADDGELSLPSPPPPGTKKFLLLCAKKRMNSIGLKNVELTSVGHDEVLFHKIRTAYRELRGGRSKNPFLVPKTIEYIKFELLNRRKSGVCVGNFEVDSIPTLKSVLQGQYAYRPCPPDIGKHPIHPHIFMHAFLCPGDHTGTVATERLPKKLHDELRAVDNDPFNLPTGWGIYMVEGYNWPLIRVLLAVLLLICFILAVAWSALQNDTQGGMGIGQFSIAFVIAALSAVFLGRTGWDGIEFLTS